MWVGVRAGEKGHECDGGGLFCSLGCFSGLFFKLKNEKVILACLQTRLILAERPDASTPCMYFHTCAAGCVRTLRLAQHSWKVCGSMSASSEGATGGREGGGGGGDAGGRRATTPISFGVCCALEAAPRRQPSGFMSRPRYFVFALTGGL